MNTRKMNALETRNKIYNAAKILINRYGFENVSVDSIVEAAGVAKGSFYVHFDTKDSLAAAFISDYVNEVDIDYKAFIDSFDARTSASENLLSLIEKITDILIHEIGYDQIRILYKIQITKTAMADAVLSYNRVIYKLFHDILNKGIQQEEFKTEISLDELTKHCMMAIRGVTYEWCIRYPDFDYKEEALQHFRVLLTGIKKRS